MTQEEIQLEKLKIAYDKVADQHRYYLSWRQFLLGGYFAIIGALFYSAYVIYDKNDVYKKWTFIITLSISFISWLFLQLDKRNRDLYHVCQRVGSKIEQELFSDLDAKSKDNKGLFFTLDKSQENSSYWTHSTLLNLLYKSIIYFGLLLTVYLFITKTLGIHCGCTV